MSEVGSDLAVGALEAGGAALASVSGPLAPLVEEGTQALAPLAYVAGSTAASAGWKYIQQQAAPVINNAISTISGWFSGP